MERRSERFVKKIVQEKGKMLETRPKRVKRVAGQVISRVKNAIERAPHIGERIHFKEQEGLDQLDLELHTPENIGMTSVGEVDNSLAAKIPRHIMLAAEVADREQPEPDLEWNTDHAQEDIKQLSFEDLRGRRKAIIREEREFQREPLADQND